MARLLVVEDDATIAVGLMDNLTLEGHQVELARDGFTAEQRALAGGLDLILLDLMLPKKDGVDVCRDLRQAGVRTPIIVLTARTRATDKVLGLETGADDYVTKPFDPRELVARINAVLRRTVGTAPTGPVQRFGDLTVDFARLEVMRGSRRVELTAMELRILQTFIRHRGEVLTPGRIAADVWGEGVFITNRVLYTHVSNLRRKIENNPVRPRLLVTVRGFGYRFEG